MKSVDKCKRYSAFYPEKQELPHSLACVYWPVITSPRWRRVGTSQQRSVADNGASMYICLWPTRSDCQTVSSSVPCRCRYDTRYVKRFTSFSNAVRTCKEEVFFLNSIYEVPIDMNKLIHGLASLGQCPDLASYLN